MNPLTFDGIDLSPYIGISSITRHVAPSRRLVRTAIAGGYGERVVPDGLEPLEIAVKGHVRARSMGDVNATRRLLSSALLKPDERELCLEGEPDVHYMAYYLGGAELSRAAHCPDVTLRFLCPDPRAYGRLRSYAPPSDRTGTYHEFEIDVGGNADTHLRVVTGIDPDMAKVEIENLTSGKKLELYNAHPGIPIPWGHDQLDIDMAMGRVTSATNAAVPSLASDFFCVSPSENDGRCKLKVTSKWLERVEWYERWT